MSLNTSAEIVHEKRQQNLGRFMPVAVLAILCLLFAVICPGFLTSTNVFNVLRQVAITGILAVGETFVILTGGIDLSVGSLLAFTGVIAASLQVNHTGSLVSVVVAILTGGCIGLIMGLLVSKAGVPSFIVTLGGLEALRGATLLYSNGSPITPATDFDRAFTFLGQGFLGPVPFPVIIFAATILIGHLILKRFRFGRYIYATGDNPEAALLSGLKVGNILTSVYVLSGLCAGLAGVLLTSRLGSGDPTTGNGFELTAIAAVVIGGTSLFGGRGGVLGTLIGSLLIGIISNGLLLLNVSSYLQPVVIGGIIILAVFADQVVNRRRT